MVDVLYFDEIRMSRTHTPIVADRILGTIVCQRSGHDPCSELALALPSALDDPDDHDCRWQRKTCSGQGRQAG
jgi:hypothetical protein